MVSAPEVSKQACDVRMDMATWLLSTALCPGKGVKYPETKGRSLSPGHS